MKKSFEIQTGAEMYFVDLAITCFLNSLKDEVQDENMRNLFSIFLKPIKKRLEHRMTHEWNMSLGEELKLIESYC